MDDESADSQSARLAKRKWHLSRRLARALEAHYLPDSDAVRAARSTLRTALMGEPVHARESELLAYRDRALRRFEVAVGLVPGSPV